MAVQKGSPPTYTPEMNASISDRKLSFWRLLTCLPVVESISDNVRSVYEGVKSTPVVGMGLRIAEGSYQSVLREVEPYTNSVPVKFLDDVACGLLYAVENNFEIVQKTPDEICEDIQSTVTTGVEGFVQSFAGQFVLSGLELAVLASESVLNMIEPRDAGLDIEPEETDGESTPGGRQTTIDELWGLKEVTKPESTSLIYKSIKTVRRIFATPFHISTLILKLLYNSLSKFDETLDPEKRKEIKGRRKLTARRHYSNSLARRILTAIPPLGFIFRMAGLVDEHLKISKLLDLTGKDSVGRSPVKSANDRGTKRDYSEYTNDVLDFDAENYKSSEDEDYVPSNAESTDSDEYIEGETESDIEKELKEEQNSYSLPTSNKRITKGKSAVNTVAKTAKENEDTRINVNNSTPSTVNTADIQSNVPLKKDKVVAVGNINSEVTKPH